MKLIWTVLLLTYAVELSAQREPPDFNHLMEALFQWQGEEVDYEYLYETLLSAYNNPLPLNELTFEELAALGLLSPDQLYAFFEYRKSQGPFIALYELQSIPSWDPLTIKNILPFLTVQEKKDNRSLPQRIIEAPNSYLMVRYGRTLETTDGYTRENGYLGSPNNWSGRFRISSPKDFSLGLLVDHDAGEKIQWNRSNKQWGADFYSFHFVFYGQSRLKTLALGDYQIQFGQGLVWGSGFSLGKGGETITSIRRGNIGVRPYTSSVESGYLRGGAVTFSLGNTYLSAWLSRKHLDATLETDSVQNQTIARSLPTSGWHRTTNELAKRRQMTEIASGINWCFTRDRFTLGTTHAFQWYNHPISSKPTSYNQFGFHGSSNWNGSIYASYNWQNFLFFSEVAQSLSGGRAVLVGWLATLTRHLDLSWCYRNYAVNYHAPYGNGFGESNSLINEKGAYIGIKFQPKRQHQFSGFIDYFEFPWLKFQVSTPSSGFEYLVRYQFQPNKKTSWMTQWRLEKKERNETSDLNLQKITQATKTHFISQISYTVFGDFQLKTRIQFSKYQLPNQTTQGVLLLQDVAYSWHRWRWNSRIALFDTEDFNNAQYVFEKEIPYSFAIPVLNGMGLRSYLMIQYRLSPALTMWGKLARFTYYQTSAIGSGSATIPGNHRTDLRLMIRYQFHRNG